MSTSPISFNFTPFSATPLFTFSPGEFRAFKMILTGDVTASTVDTSTLTPGARVVFIIQQDAVGGRAFAWAPNCLGAQPVAQPPNAITVSSFIFDGKNLLLHGLPAIF
jgi:hypothetical protein